jgi:hypothetical protein
MLIIRLLGAQAVLDGATGRIRTGSSRTLALARPADCPHRPAAGSDDDCGAILARLGDGQALTNLRRELHDLRRILGEDESWRSLQVSSVGTTEGATISI